MFLEQIASRRIELALAEGGASPKKAKIINLDRYKNLLMHPFDYKIEVSFNPREITYKASPPVYKDKPAAGKIGGHRMSYAGNKSNELHMKLLFDTTMSGDNVYTEYIKFLVDLLTPDPDKKTHQPPLCRFEWGKFTVGDMYFDAVLCNLDVDYTWFLANGKPVRAETKLTFRDPETPKGKHKGTNPTSRSEARSVWRVVEGQTLDWIAFKEYGDSAAWRHIALVNNLQNPRELRPGMILKLLPLP